MSDYVKYSSMAEGDVFLDPIPSFEVTKERVEKYIQSTKDETEQLQIKDDRGQHEPFETEDQGLTKGLLPEIPNRGTAPQHHQKVIAEHRGRQDQRQHHERLEQSFAAKALIGQHPPHDHGDGQQQDNRPPRQTQRQQERRPVHQSPCGREKP